MRKFKLYAGLGGSFGGATFQEVRECRDEQEAEQAAYDLAIEEYESYGGLHGLLDYEGCYEDLKESDMFDTIDENEIDDMVTAHYYAYMESWLEYYVEEVTE